MHKKTDQPALNVYQARILLFKMTLNRARPPFSLARACYADSDVYLLDDPLSAVDAHVGLHLLNEVLSRRTGLLATKTCILVTHSVKALPFSDRIALLQAGRLGEVGTYRQLTQARNSQLNRFLATTAAATHQETEEENLTSDTIDDDEGRLEAPSPLPSLARMRSSRGNNSNYVEGREIEATGNFYHLPSLFLCGCFVLNQVVGPLERDLYPPMMHSVSLSMGGRRFTHDRQYEGNNGRSTAKVLLGEAM